MNTTEYTLGQRVRYAEHITRRSRRSHEVGPGRVWSGELYPGKRTDGGEGIIIGKRTLSNGDVQWMGEDGGNIFVRMESFTAYLVAFNLHRKPVHVLPEHLTAVES